jgi:hypothetical protein
VRSLILRHDHRKNESRGGQQSCPNPGSYALGTLGTRLIEPKTPFYRRFALLAFILLDRAQHPVSGSPNPKAARLRALQPAKDAKGAPTNTMSFESPSHRTDWRVVGASPLAPRDRAWRLAGVAFQGPALAHSPAPTAPFTTVGHRERIKNKASGGPYIPVSGR